MAKPLSRTYRGEQEDEHGLVFDDFGRLMDEEGQFWEEEYSAMDVLMEVRDDFMRWEESCGEEENEWEACNGRTEADGFTIGPHVDLNDPMDGQIVQKFKLQGFDHVQYYGSPSSYEELMEWIDEILSSGNLESPKVAIRQSCINGSPVVMIYDEDGLEYHIETRRMTPELDWRMLHEQLLSEGISLRLSML